MQSLLHRSKYVLERLAQMRSVEPIPLSDAEYDEARKQFNQGKLPFRTTVSEKEQGLDAEHYVKTVLARLPALLEQGDKIPSRTVVETALDRELQHYVEAAFADTLQELRRKASFPHPEALNGAVVVLDTWTQEVMAMVGGLGSRDGDYLNRATRNYLIPGSAVKPLVLAYGLEHGLINLKDEFLDQPVTFYIADAPLGKRLYSPRNFKNEWSGKNMNLHDALVHSKNGIFVQLNEKLIAAAGREALQAWMGQVGLPVSFYGLSSVLGPHETSLLDLVGAYMLIAGDGTVTRYPTGDINTTFVRTARQGDDVLYSSIEKEQVLRSETVQELDQSLRGVVSSGTGRSAAMEWYDVRGKTGTSPRSFLFVGYEPILHTLVAVQFSSDNPKLTGKLSDKYIGGEYATPLARKVLEYRVESR